MSRILISIVAATAVGFAAHAQAPNADPNAPNPPPSAAPSPPPAIIMQPLPSESVAPQTSNDTKLTPSQPAKFVVTAADEKKWIGRPVYSSDDKKLGEITGLSRDADNNVTEVYYDSGGFLGIGTVHHGVTSAQIKEVLPDRLVLTLTQAAADKIS